MISTCTNCPYERHGLEQKCQHKFDRPHIGHVKEPGLVNTNVNNFPSITYASEYNRCSSNLETEVKENRELSARRGPSRPRDRELAASFFSLVNAVDHLVNFGINASWHTLRGD